MSDDDNCTSGMDFPELVIVDWDDLGDGIAECRGGSSTGNSNSALARALGPDGIGLIAIRNVPGFVEAKDRLLPMAHQLVNLPPDYLEGELSDPTSLYNTGWSHGKEKLGDMPDFGKGSFYYNPVTDLAGTPELREQYPLSYPPNKWPDEEQLDQMVGFKDAATTLGKILFVAAVRVAKHFDVVVRDQVKGYDPNFLYDAMKDTDKVKGRLLYYFPLKGGDGNADTNDGNAAQSKEDSWIGWHNDSGFLTALAGDIYVDHATGKRVDTCPDPEAGLYVIDRRHPDRPRNVKLPYDCLAVQIGECTQIVTGGVLAATPHCVRGIRTSRRDEEGSSSTTATSACSNIARISLACFIDTKPTFPLFLPKNDTADGADTPKNATSSAATREHVLGIVNPRVPPLDDRWTHDGMTFGDFLQRTFGMYYDWTKSSSTKGQP